MLTRRQSQPHWPAIDEAMIIQRGSGIAKEWNAIEREGRYAIVGDRVSSIVPFKAVLAVPLAARLPIFMVDCNFEIAMIVRLVRHLHEQA